MMNIPIDCRLICLAFAVLAVSCGKSTSKEASGTGESYIKYSINGSLINGAYTISVGDNGHAMVIVHDRNSEEGMLKVAALNFLRDDQASEAHISMPARTGEFVLDEDYDIEADGEVTDKGDTGARFVFPPADVFYDIDGDGESDIKSALYSGPMSVTITAYEESRTNFGMRTAGHIKGSFEGTAFFTAFSYSTSEPVQQVLHTVTGEFEYNLP